MRSLIACLVVVAIGCSGCDSRERAQADYATALDVYEKEERRLAELDSQRGPENLAASDQVMREMYPQFAGQLKAANEQSAELQKKLDEIKAKTKELDDQLLRGAITADEHNQRKLEVLTSAKLSSEEAPNLAYAKTITKALDEITKDGTKENLRWKEIRRAMPIHKACYEQVERVERAKKAVEEAEKRLKAFD